MSDIEQTAAVDDGGATLLTEAQAHIERKDKPAATEILKRIAKLETCSSDVRSEAARLLMLVGASSAAADCYLRAGIAYLYDEVEITKARQAFASAFSLDPQNLDILFHMGQADVVEGRTKEALAKFIDVLRKSNVGHLPALFEAGCIYQAMAQFDQAILAFKKVMDHDKKHVQAIVHMGQLHQSKGMLPEAIGYYIRAAELARDLKQVGTARQLASMVLSLDVRNQKARFIVDDVDQQSGERAQTQTDHVPRDDSALARFVSRATPKARLELQSQVKQLTATLRQADQAGPDAAKAEMEALRAERDAIRHNIVQLRKENLSIVRAKAAEELALQELSAKREALREAVEQLSAAKSDEETALARLRSECESTEADASLLAQRNEALRGEIARLEDDQSGSSASKKAESSQLRPTSRGYALLAAGDSDGALEAFRDAHRAQPDDAQAAYQLGCLLADRGDFAAAETLLESAAEFRPDHAATQFRLALIKAMRGAIVPAVGLLRQLARSEPGGTGFIEQFVERLEEAATDGSALTKYRLAIAYRELGRLEEALAMLQSIQHVPEFAGLCLSAIGLCLRRQGLEAAAARRFAKAVETPGLPSEQYHEALYNLGDIYEAKGDPDSLALALSSFEELYARDLSYRDVGERLRAVGAKLSATQRAKVKHLPTRTGDAPRQ